jgi:hypothetical protein
MMPTVKPIRHVLAPSGFVICAILAIFISILPLSDKTTALEASFDRSCLFIHCDPVVKATQPGVVIAVQFSSDHSDIAGNWRLVKTPGPDNTREIVSIMRTAEALKSDPDFAGLTIRCGEQAGFQIAFVVIRPFPPRSRPEITVSDGRSNARFEALVLPSGSMLSLPAEAEVLARGSWQATKELTVDIEGDGAKIHGIVSLTNLSGAISLLQANCHPK